jgi:hypothetical protein
MAGLARSGAWEVREDSVEQHLRECPGSLRFDRVNDLG